MGLFSRRKQQADPFGGTGYVPGADPAPAPSPAPGPEVGIMGASGVIDARGVRGLREDVMKLALSGGTPDQIMAALREHGIAVPDGTPVTMMQAEAMMAPSPAAAAPAAGGEEDPAARLRRLQELRGGDLITEAEFQAQRARVLEEL